MRKFARFLLLLIVCLGVTGAVLANATSKVSAVELPPEGLYKRSELNSEPGPVTPLPNVPIGTIGLIPGVGTSPTPVMPSAAASETRFSVGGGALPGAGAGIGTSDPLLEAERGMRRLIRRLDG